MKVEITKKSEEGQKYPFLAYDKHNNLCLVGRFCAIMLEKQNGNSYDHNGLEQFKGEDRRFARDMQIILTQD